jgi:menaquinone-dependent protoporphyrinogen oxidase
MTNETNATSVLIAYATRHGATKEIAETVRDTLVGRGLRAVATPVQDVGGLGGFDAVILGSAVYMGRWMKGARAFAEEQHEVLSGKNVWLFSSGPVGPDSENAEEPWGIGEIQSALGAHSHQMFAGKLDKAELGMTERAVIRMVKAPEGDYRDWDEIRDWANKIADQLAERDAA